MKKEDFIVGKWYVSSLWVTFIAAKFSGFDKHGFYSFSESIYSGVGRHLFNLSFTTTDKQGWSTFREVDLSEIEEYLPKGHPDLKLTTIDLSFPTEGCYFDDEGIVLNHLKSLGYNPSKEYNHRKSEGRQYVKWDNNHYWYICSNSINTKNYTTQQINQFLNINKNEVLKIKTENTRPIIKGAIGLRSRGQQITAGSRHQGNSASIITCKAKSVSIEISKNIVKRSNS